MSRVLVRLSLVTMALVVWGVTSTPAYADGAAQIKDRQALLKSIGGKMKAIGGILKGKGDPASIGAHTAELAALSKKVGAAFPAGSGPDAGKTYSKPNIWTDQAAFNKIVAQLVSSTENLAKAGASGDLKAVGPAMGMLGKTACGACHKTYRKKKEK
jgi:cytochrome c556